MSPDVSIIIVSFNTKDILRLCLASILQYTNGVTFEIIVVDNGSADGSAAMVEAEFSGITVIRAGKNLGFAAGQNIGLKQAKGTYWLVLNSDIIFVEDCVTALVKYFRDSGPTVGVIGPRVLNSDGTLAPSARKNRLSTPLIVLSVLNRHFNYGRWIPQEAIRRRFGRLLASVHDNFSPHDHTRTVEYVDGMCCMLRRQVLEKVGLFDEQFFFDAEILDLSNRIRKHNWQIIYFAETTVTHLKHSSRKTLRRIIVETTRSEMIYYAKYFPDRIPVLRAATSAIVSLKLFINRLKTFVRRTPELDSEHDILTQVLAVARSFRPDLVKINERIPYLGQQ